MQPAVRTSSLSKSFGNVHALKAVSFEVQPGEIFALLGRNGAGKTTLIKLLATLYSPDEGQALIFGLDTVKDARQIHAMISLAAGEERGFYWRLSGRQNLEFFGALYNLRPEHVRRKISELSSVLELENLDKRFDLYSAGQKQRLSLARAFMQESKLVFLDEPTRSLDPLARYRFRALIKKLAAEHGKTFILATHDIHEAEELADRMGILEKGRLAACGTLEEIRLAETASGLEEIFRKISEEECTHVS